MLLTYVLIIIGLCSFIIAAIVSLRQEDAKKYKILNVCLIVAAISTIGLWLKVWGVI